LAKRCILVVLTLAIAESGFVRLEQPMSTLLSKQPKRRIDRVEVKLDTPGTWQKNRSIL
jgi:hypothetical protein